MSPHPALLSGDCRPATDQCKTKRWRFPDWLLSANPILFWLRQHVPDIFFQCDSCGNQQVVNIAGPQAQLSCPDCGSKYAVPQTAIGQNCPHCNQAVKIDPTLKGAVLQCHGCKKSILLPVRRGDQIVCLCKRCEKTIAIPVAEAGQLLACPKCDDWITGPELKDVVDGLLASHATANPPTSWAPAAARTPKKCPTCHQPMDAEAGLCLHCRLDFEPEKKIAASIGAEPRAATTTPAGSAGVDRPKSYPHGSAQAVLQTLETEAQHLASNQCFLLASFLLKYYDGEYAEETLAARLQLASSYSDTAIQRNA